MKNFYEITDTNLINITVRLIPNSSPTVTVIINKIALVINDKIDKPTTLSTTIDVRSALNIHIEVENGHVEIENIYADNILLVPTYTHLSTYSDQSMHPTTVVRSNNQWKLNTTVPILWWIHEHSGNGWLLYP